MATATQGSFVGRSAATVTDNAKFNKVVTKTATDYYMTGSEMSSDGFIVESAGDTKLTFTGGGQIATSAVTAKTLYEIGVSRVSGSGTVHLVF